MHGNRLPRIESRDSSGIFSQEIGEMVENFGGMFELVKKGAFAKDHRDSSSPNLR